MKLVKMVGLTVMAMSALTAIVGVAPAAADHEVIGLCTAEQLLLCEASKLITPGAGDKLVGTQEGTGEFTGSALGAEKCTSGSSEAEPTAPDTNPYIVKNMTFTFSGCTPCTSVTVEKIAEAKISMGTVGGNDWTLKGTGGAKFEGCPFGVKCKFGGSEVSTLIEMAAGKLAWVNTNGTKLKLQEGSKALCGSEGQWFAKFNLSYKLANGTVHDVWPTLLNPV